METKICKKCSKEKPLEDFFKNRITSDGRQVYCKTCQDAINRAYYAAHKEKQDKYRAEWHRKQRKRVVGYFQDSERRKTLKKFGKPLEWYEQTLAEQNGVCAICGKPETATHQNGRVVSLAIDHDHASGKVRGLLCRLCNHALHSVEETPYWPFQAVAYLSKFK
jgi:hypothetical protein